MINLNNSIRSCVEIKIRKTTGKFLFSAILSSGGMAVWDNAWFSLENAVYNIASDSVDRFTRNFIKENIR